MDYVQPSGFRKDFEIWQLCHKNANAAKKFMSWALIHKHLESEFCDLKKEKVLTNEIACILQIPDSGKMEPGLVRSNVPRFCDEVRRQTPEYSKYFQHVFINKTFRIYKVV